MDLDALNSLSKEEAMQALERCCGSHRWCEAMEGLRPFRDQAQLFLRADQVWSSLDQEDWHEAFRHHPRIGDIGSLRAKFAATANWASDEQKGATAASEETLKALAAGNQEYEARFGHIFLVCATGKSADEMLALLRARMSNVPDAELRVAVGEQAKITRLRLEKLLS